MTEARKQAALEKQNKITEASDTRMPVSYRSRPCYEICLEQDFTALGEELDKLQLSDRKLCIVTDSHVERLYGAAVQEIVQAHCKKCVLFSFPEGEAQKNLDTVRKLYGFLIQEGFDRKDLLIALGGGVVGDLTGFAAATYLRGVSFIQIPTTLLAQVDSSIGGKTGVDFDAYKNMVGAFHMPSLVYMNLSVLNSLEERQYFSGFAEVMKAALIRDASFYTWLLEHIYEICGRDPATVKEMVRFSCEIKRRIVEKDPTEQGERALLNFGHTIGHAVEKYKNFTLLHGECVALGCVAAAFISYKRGLLSTEEYYEVRDMFVPFNLPISVEELEPEAVLKLTGADKKRENGKIHFILLKKAGHAYVETNVTDEEILAGIHEICFTEEDWDA